MSTFGQTGIGASYDDGDGDCIISGRFTLTETGTVSGVSGYLDNQSAGHAACYCRGVIYSTTGSYPTTLQAVSAPVALSDNQAPGWVYFGFSSPPSLPAADYWLGIHLDSNANGVKIYRDTSGGYFASTGATYSSGTPTTYPTGGQNTANPSFYATYTAGGGTTRNGIASSIGYTSPSGRATAKRAGIGSTAGNTASLGSAGARRSGRGGSLPQALSLAMANRGRRALGATFPVTASQAKAGGLRSAKGASIPGTSSPARAGAVRSAKGSTAGLMVSLGSGYKAGVRNAIGSTLGLSSSSAKGYATRHGLAATIALTLSLSRANRLRQGKGSAMGSTSAAGKANRVRSGTGASAGRVVSSGLLAVGVTRHAYGTSMGGTASYAMGTDSRIIRRPVRLAPQGLDIPSGQQVPLHTQCIIELGGALTHLPNQGGAKPCQ